MINNKLSSSTKAHSVHIVYQLLVRYARTCHSHLSKHKPINVGPILMAYLEAQAVRCRVSFSSLAPEVFVEYDKGYVCLIITLIFRWKMREMGTFASMHQQDCCCLSALRNKFLLSPSTLPQVTSLILLAILGLLPSSQTVSSSSRVNNYTSSLTGFFMLRSCKALHSPVPISVLSPGRMEGNLNPWKIKRMEKLALYIKRSLHL